MVRRPQHATTDSNELQCFRELVHILFDESKSDVRRVLMYYTTRIYSTSSRLLCIFRISVFIVYLTMLSVAHSV